jgi:hypothetical protein
MAKAAAKAALSHSENDSMRDWFTLQSKSNIRVSDSLSKLGAQTRVSPLDFNLCFAGN